MCTVRYSDTGLIDRSHHRERSCSPASSSASRSSRDLVDRARRGGLVDNRQRALVRVRVRVRVRVGVRVGVAVRVRVRVGVRVRVRVKG